MSDQPTLAGVPSEGTDLPTVCVLCSHNCGIRVDVREGRIVEVRADESNPISKGYICNKAFSIQHYVEHGDRVPYPMRRRRGPRSESSRFSARSPQARRCSPRRTSRITSPSPSRSRAAATSSCSRFAATR